MVVSDNQVLQTVPGREERDSDKETERSAQVGDEGDGGEGPDFLLDPDFCGGEAVDEGEVTSKRDLMYILHSPLYVCMYLSLYFPLIIPELPL